MKKIISTALFCALLFSGFSACQEDPSFAELHPNPKPVAPAEPEPVETDLHAIHDLNKAEGYLNSHNREWQNSTLEMDYRSFVTLTQGKPLACAYPNYPRIKKLADGSYMLSYQQNTSAHDVYYLTSKNLLSWQAAPAQLFEKQDWKQFDGVTDDRILFSSADEIVLANGDILAFASFRLNKGYRLDPRNNGIMMRRSTDNAATWGEYQKIYTGTTWEPSALQLKNGEIHVYFTDADVNKGDSGTSLLRSTDNGQTWEYVRKVVREKSGTAIDGSGDVIFTNQMPVAIQLNGSDRIAVAFESRFGSGDEAKYHVGLAYTNDNWAAGAPEGDIDSPEDRQNSLYQDVAAPYLRQFRSGETVLTYNQAKKFGARIGDAKAYKFGDRHQLFDVSSAWGSVELIDNHSLLAVYPSSYTKDGATCSDIVLAKFVLNHRINATAHTPAMEGGSNSWAEVPDALFIGSAFQAQVALRFAYDSQNLYCLLERKDEKLTSADGMRLLFQSGDMTGDPLVLELTMGDKGLVCADKEIKVATTLLGAMDEFDDDEGYVAEMAIPLSKLRVAADRLLFNAVLLDDAGTDTFTGLTATNFDKWLSIELKAEAAPIVEPDPGNSDNGTGPSWTEGDEFNPWNK